MKHADAELQGPQGPTLCALEVSGIVQRHRVGQTKPGAAFHLRRGNMLAAEVQDFGEVHFGASSKGLDVGRWKNYCTNCETRQQENARTVYLIDVDIAESPIRRQSASESTRYEGVKVATVALVCRHRVADLETSPPPSTSAERLGRSVAGLFR